MRSAAASAAGKDQGQFAIADAVDAEVLRLRVRLGFVVSHPFRKVRGMDGARGFLGWSRVERLGCASRPDFVLNLLQNVIWTLFTVLNLRGE